MLFELFKNSMRAVMEHHGEDSDNYPAVEVMLVRGKEDICVKVQAISSELTQLSGWRTIEPEIILFLFLSISF